MFQTPRPNSLSQVIILSVSNDDLTPTQAALRFRVSRAWIYQLLARYKADGLEGLEGLESKSQRLREIPGFFPPNSALRSSDCELNYWSGV